MTGASTRLPSHSSVCWNSWVAGPASAVPSAVSGASSIHVSIPQQLPSVFQSRYCVPSSSVKTDAIDGSALLERADERIALHRERTDPSRTAEVATPMHCLLDSVWAAVKYMA